MYTCIVRQGREPLQKGGRSMKDMNVTEALLRAVLELIDKCDTLDELRESVKRVMGK